MMIHSRVIRFFLTIAWILELSIVILMTLPFLLLPVTAGRFLGRGLYYLSKSRREIAIRNVDAAFKNRMISAGKGPEAIVKAYFEELGQSIVEIVKLYYGKGEKILDKIRITGLDNLQKAREKGRGIIFITGHCGNWELLAIAASLKVMPVSVVARPLNNPYLNRLIEGVRSRYGNTVIYKKGALKEIIRRLRNNGAVGILMDQSVIPEEGIITDFLGRPAWTTKMPVLIARKTGSPILPVFIRRNGSEQEITIYPEVMLLSNKDDESLKKNIGRLNSFIEGYIKDNPEQWLWIHRRWKRVPEDKEV